MTSCPPAPRSTAPCTATPTATCSRSSPGWWRPPGPVTRPRPEPSAWRRRYAASPAWPGTAVPRAPRLRGRRWRSVRVGIVSDIHCNAEGLRTALEVMGPLDALLCPGDLIYAYQYSRAVVDILRETDAQVVLGNHELAFLG